MGSNINTTNFEQTILIYKARGASMCVSPPISNVLYVFALQKVPQSPKMLNLLCKKFLKDETRSYVGLKARIARTEKLVSHNYLDSRRVQQTSDHILTATVGCEMKRSQASLSGQFPHQTLGWSCWYLNINITLSSEY